MDKFSEILKYLIKDFLPPIEREDIIMLSNLIDDTIDCIDEVVINIDILTVVYLRNDIKQAQGCLDAAGWLWHCHPACIRPPCAWPRRPAAR